MSFSKPVDLSNKKRESDCTATTSSSSKLFPPLPPLAPMPSSTASASPIFALPPPFNAAGQPVLDLHSALNNIHTKYFTIGTSLPSRSSFRKSSVSLSPTRSSPCPPPQLTSLWSSITDSKLGSPFALQTGLNQQPINYSMSGTTAPPPPPPASPASSVTMKNPAPPPSLVQSMPLPPSSATALPASKYNQLLAVLDEMAKDVRPSYAGSKTSVERLKRSIARARFLVHEALLEAEKNSRN